MAHAVFTHDTAALAHRPGHILVAVRVEMPHVKKYGKTELMDLTYASSSMLTVGQKVLCPPTRLNAEWTRGTVLAVYPDLNAADYRGRVKYIKPLPQRRRKAA